jgi:hypothetical protein
MCLVGLGVGLVLNQFYPFPDWLYVVGVVLTWGGVVSGLVAVFIVALESARGHERARGRARRRCVMARRSGRHGRPPFEEIADDVWGAVVDATNNYGLLTGLLFPIANQRRRHGDYPFITSTLVRTSLSTFSWRSVACLIRSRDPGWHH